MPVSRRILILGGTGEAAALAEALAARPDLEPITSLAGRTREPRPLPGRVRSGGFGGPQGLAAFIASEHIAAVIDATHPFAAQISRHASQASSDKAVPLLRLERPAWVRQPGDQWLEVASVAEAVPAVRQFGARVFLTIGRTEIEPFSGLAGIWFLLRVAEPATEALPFDGELVIARGPFDEGSEISLLRRHAIDLLVTKNSGGEATVAKIAAARRLGLPVVMVGRPARPPKPPTTVASVAQALDWIETQLFRR